MYKFNVFILLTILTIFASKGLTQASSGAAAEANLNGIVLSMESMYFSNPSELASSGLANNSLTVNGSALKVSKGIDLDEFIAFSETQITNTFAKFIRKHNLNGTTDYILLDMEGVAGPRHFGKYLTEYEDDVSGRSSTSFDDIVNAYKLRISVARTLLPHAKICLYGMPIPTNHNVHSSGWIQQLQGFTRAGQLGLFDHADYVVPVCYLRYCSDDSSNYTEKNKQETTMAIQGAQSFVKSDGSHIPVFPLITPTYFGNSSCSKTLISAAELWQQISWIKALQVDTIGLWVGTETLPGTSVTIPQYANQLLQAANQNGSGS